MTIKSVFEDSSYGTVQQIKDTFKMTNCLRFLNQSIMRLILKRTSLRRRTKKTLQLFKMRKINKKRTTMMMKKKTQIATAL